MKLTHSIIVVALAASASANATTGIFGSYAEITTTSSTIYVAQSYGGSNPSFDGANFGSFTVADTLALTNASAVTFKNGDSSNTGSDVFGAEIQWRVFKNGDTPGGFTTIGLDFEANATATDIGGQTFSGGGDQEWRDFSGGGSADLIAAATAGNGDYTVEIFFRSTNNGTEDTFSNNGGSNYTAQFTLVPEPSVALLGGIGLLGLLRRRR
ncbi:MAG: PEP-CTERM sorting domain-containing protein [Verrucomicrobiota bacterium]